MFENLANLDLRGCYSIKSEDQLNLLTAVMDHDFEKGLNLASKLCLGHDEFANFLTPRFQEELKNDATPRELLLKIADFISSNQSVLNLKKGNPLVDMYHSIMAKNILNTQAT